MKVEAIIDAIGADFYTGVPDSLLQPLCGYLMNTYGDAPQHHIIAANEGNAAAIAAGYHLATGKLPVVYMQNSGIGNIINPVTSLLHQRVYGIPSLFIVGWRAEPGLHDEPQHVLMGDITRTLLEDVGVSTYTVYKDTTAADVTAQMEKWKPLFAAGKSAALVIRKGALTYDGKVCYKNEYPMTREQIVRCVTEAAGEDMIVSTTGKASRELYELRDASAAGHGHDFLTVGSMGHSSSIALGIALQRPDVRVWCIEGDGAVLMHMGALAVIGAKKPANLIQILINNMAHESVGGMPTVAGSVQWEQLAKACGYPYACGVSTQESLCEALAKAKAADTLCLIEAKAAIGAREDLGRPKTSPVENKNAFMQTLHKSADK